jgi:hypothetical protein
MGWTRQDYDKEAKGSSLNMAVVEIVIFSFIFSGAIFFLFILNYEGAHHRYEYYLGIFSLLLGAYGILDKAQLIRAFTRRLSAEARNDP